ncbi:TetR family transcriptional regulator [Streptomyces chromofuscus]|uniref:TetR family transcriptional regulator n=1 Tax=Streptomyces chromofuscus TaxID=42881 RepID=A0A7M2TB90_STRCW|nr:TetR family transcriptional regulator [Streptomyces chromofuscus]QOV44611.1 TetR family transcriptional regulator [Streptomyces chromofuscus]GGT01864.1 putative transcriptional regulator, TetR family protein [Streptomyces chromofuscus]
MKDTPFTAATDGCAAAVPPREAWRRKMRGDVLDAARAMAAEKGWDSVSLSEVATRAEVSRPTVYKEFGSRGGLSQALVHREAERFLLGVDRALQQPAATATDALAAAILYALRQARENVLVASVVKAARGGTDSLLPYLTARSEPVVAGARLLVRSWCQTHYQQFDDVRTDQAADVIVRLTLSHIVLPPPEHTLRVSAELITAAAMGVLTRETGPPTTS